MQLQNRRPKTNSTGYAGVKQRTRNGRTYGVRVVYAYARGTVESVNTNPDVSGMRRVTINPKRQDTFMCDGEPVLAAGRVVFVNGAGWML